MKAAIIAILLVGCLSAISTARRPVVIKTDSEITCSGAGGLCIASSVCLPENKSNTTATCPNSTDVCCHQGGDLKFCKSHGGECMAKTEAICQHPFAQKNGTECEEKNLTCCVAF